MAVYRETGRRRRWPLIGVGVVIVIGVLVGLVLLSRPRSDSAADVRAVANSALDTLAQSVDLFDIEYSKIRSGSAPSQTGAPGALRKAMDTLNASKDSLRLRNGAAYDALQADLNALTSGLNATSPPDLAASIADAQTQIQRLRQSTP